jgi:hypothetical protein
MHWILLVTLIGARIDFEQVRFASQAACLAAERAYHAAPVQTGAPLGSPQVPLEDLSGVFLATACVSDGAGP